MFDLLLPLGDPLLPARPETTARWLEFFEARYADSQDPIFAWEAIRHAVVANHPLPPFALLYLGRVALSFHDMSRTQIPRVDIAPAVYRALEFRATKGVNPFRSSVPRITMC